MESAVTQNSQRESDWIERLAEALDVLAQAVTAVRINSPTLTTSQFRSLAEKANRDPNANLLFEEYIPALNSDPATAIGILQEHPIIRCYSAVAGGKPAVMTLMPPGNASRLELDWLVCWLTKTSVRKGGIHTAQILDEILTLSEAKALPAQEITLFLGLRVEQRFDFGKAAFIAPYEQVVEEGLLTERNNAPWENHPDYNKLEVAAVVRDFTWGPVIGAPMTSNTSPGERILEMSFPCLGDMESLGIIFDFLAIVTRCKLDILSIQYRGTNLIENFAPNFSTGIATAFVEANSLRPYQSQGKPLAVEHVDALREVLTDWSSGDVVVRRALRRLASSVARTGGFRLEDSILDLTIALEVMYSIDNEMTYKLGTRAGHFLGCDAEERVKVFDVVKKLYDKRSEIVHGRRTNYEELKSTFTGGFEVARDTLFKQLRTVIAKDRHQFWNRLVMTGEMPSTTTKPSNSKSSPSRNHHTSGKV